MGLKTPNFLPPGTIPTVGSSTGSTFCCAQQGAGKTQRDGIWEILGTFPAFVPSRKRRSGTDSEPWLSPASAGWGNAGFYFFFFCVPLQYCTVQEGHCSLLLCLQIKNSAAFTCTGGTPPAWFTSANICQGLPRTQEKLFNVAAKRHRTSFCQQQNHQTKPKPQQTAALGKAGGN